MGGGAGGLAAAVALAARGVPSRVFERSRSTHEIDRGDIIHVGSRRLLQGWGAWGHVEALSPLPFTRFQMLDGNGRRLLGVDTAALLGPECHLTALRHPDIVAALRSAAAATGLVELRDHEPVMELCRDAGRVLGVRTRQREYPAMLTVVATGSRSALRDQYFGRPAIYDYDRSFFNARVKAIEGYENCGYYVLARTGVMIMVSLPHDELRIGIQFVTSARTDRPFEHNFAEWAGRILSPLQRESISLIEGHAYRLASFLARGWSIPGAVLLGDAAHTVHPTGGQGMNLAFRDAHVLAAVLADTASMADLDAAGLRYGSIRRRQVLPVYHRAHAGGVAAGATHLAATATRAAGVRLLDRVTPLKRAVFSRIVDVR